MNHSRIIFCKSIFSFLFFFCVVLSGNAQLIVTQSYTKTQLVKNVLLGPGVVASNISYTGSDSAIGFFDGTLTNLGLDSGIILTSGSVHAAIGPNNTSGATGGTGVFGAGPGDVDLTNISGTQTYDAAVLEFDFIPNADTIKFRYVFGSEEYLEYVGSFNDVFAFLISGVTTTLAPTNIALIPGTTTPVSVNNVNTFSNPSYYFDNGDGNIGNAANGLTIQYDGFTKPLTAVYKVECGEKYHIKLAVADAGDGVLDSGVFLEAGSFSSAGNSIDITAAINKDTICPKENVAINASGTFLPNTTYSWSFDGASVVSGSNVGPFFVNWPSEGKKKIKVVAQTNCITASDSIYINISDCSLKFPNVFTPNGDGKNESFKFNNLKYYPNTKLVVFNRWGNKVFEDPNYQNNWDGKDLPDGVYSFILYVPDKEPLSGYVSIFRN